MINIKFGTYQLGTRPHGLKQSEADIWSDFLRWQRAKFTQNGPDYSIGKPPPKPPPEPTFCCFAFQVRLLGGYPPPDDFDDVMRQDWETLSSLKADVIEKQGNNYTIYELKQRLDVAVLGQLLTYKWLFEEVLEFPKTTRLVAVGNSIVPGLIQPLLSHGVRIHARDNDWMIPPDFSATAIRSASFIVSTS